MSNDSGGPVSNLAVDEKNLISVDFVTLIY